MGTAQITEWDLDTGSAVSGGINFVVDFDPKSLSLTYTPSGPTQGTAPTSSGTYSEAPTQQTGSSSSLSFELTFDTTRDGSSVQAKTDQLVLFTKPAPKSANAPARKVLRFSWGAFLFYGTVTSLSQTIDFFSDAGVPLRADVRISMSEVAPADPANADDGSGGFGGAIGASASIGASVGASASFGASASIGASAGFSAGAGAGISGGISGGLSGGASIGARASVGASIGASAGVGTTPLTMSASGESIQAIAARTGSSWKVVAAANGIDNPRLLEPGTVLDASARIDVG